VPTSIADIPVGTSVQESGTNLAVLVSQRPVVVERPGVEVLSSQAWQPPKAVYVQSGGEWKQVETMKVMRNGSWQTTATELTSTVYKKQVRLSFGGRGFNQGASTSIGQMNIPNDWYVPSGWKMVYCRWSGIYDDVCDGIFLGQRTNTFDGIGTILARRSTSDYVNEDTSIWTWESIPNFTITNLRINGASNWECPWLLTASVSTEGVRCGDDGYIDLHRFPNDEQVMPNSFNQIVSVKRGSNCGTCNHFPYGVMLFEEP
jgi:hypothetical protein